MIADALVVVVGVLLIYPFVLWVDRQIIKRAEKMARDIGKGQ